MIEAILIQIDELISHAEASQNGEPDSIEHQILKNDVEEFAKTTFGVGSHECEQLDSVLHPRIYVVPMDERGRLREHLDECERIKKALMLVKHRVQSGQSKLLTQTIETERFVEPGTPHSAYVLLRELLEGAKEGVFLVDPYVSKELLPVFHNVGSSVTIRILTRQGTTPKDFPYELDLFAKEHEKILEVRYGADDFHDRFIIVDDRLFSSGASFKDLGKKASLIGEIQDTQVKAFIKQELETRWGRATPAR